MPDKVPLTGQVLELRNEQLIVSRSDLAGRIVYANGDFLAISGYREDELLGRPHSILRHPDMPKEVFADLWTDLQAGRPWIGVIKNRCKNGDAYWVEAHVSPIWEQGVITGYLSLRRKPSAAQVRAAEASHAAIRQQQQTSVGFLHGILVANGRLFRLRNAFDNASIAYKFVFLFLLAALAVFGCFAAILVTDVSQELDDNARKQLRHDVGLLRVAVAVRIEAVRREAEHHSRLLSDQVATAMGKTPGLLHGGQLAQPSAVSVFLRDFRGVGTLYTRTPEGFRRGLTNQQDAAGSLVTGSVMPGDHPALAALLAGKPYSGTVRAFGRVFLSSFHPVLNGRGEVIGAIEVGFDLAREIAYFQSEIRGLKIGESGYYYIVDVTPGADFGNLVLHPYKEGWRGAGEVPLQGGGNLIREMARLRKGELVYPWVNSEAGETRVRDKLVIFETLADPAWIIAAGAPLEEFTALSGRVAWLVVGGGLAMAAGLFVVGLWLLRKLIVKPLGSRVLPVFQHMSSGSLGSQLDVRGNDEIAQVLQGLECLQNRLAFDGEQARAFSQMREQARQEAEALSRTRAEFLANMSHEIRTPMNAVIGLAFLLLQGPLGKRERDYVKRIESAGKLLLTLINDILDFSKIDAGKLQLEAVPFQLDDVLESLSSMLRTRVQEKNLILEYVVAPDVPQGLQGDPLRLSQVLINLVGNALKFTEAGAVIVFIDVESRVEDQVRLVFRVQDSGIGMVPEAVDKLFQAFSQADSSITRKHGGTGLGLAISKRLVELMGGAIRVESQPGAGSVFSFTACLGIDESACEPLASGKHRVLVVDDNDLARTVLTSLLQKNGCVVQAADCGPAALALLAESSPFDCVMLDLIMPGMDGVELAENIRARHGIATRLILVTVANVHDGAYRDVLGGFDAVLEKPVTAARIAECLARFAQGADLWEREVPSITGGGALAGMRILVAEDVPTNQLIMQDLLAAFGAWVEVAGNGRLALQALAAPSAAFDVILMDIQMPEMDGLEASRRIREGEVRADIPIIALTAHAFEEERQRCIAVGMNDFLSKPIDPAQLLTVLRRWRPLRSLPVLPALLPLPDMAHEGACMPYLPGIDSVDGLRRMLNRTAFYEKVLRSFQARFSGEGERIRANLAERATEEARRRVHSVKGIAGTIGAMELAARALALEQAIAADGPELQSCVLGLEEELRVVVGGIERAFGLG